MSDTFRERKAKLTNVVDTGAMVETSNFVNIRIINAIPLMAFDADMLNDKSVSTLDIPAITNLAVEPCGLIDNEWSLANGDAPRFELVARVRSPLTANKVDIYIDYKYNDLILIPSLVYYNSGYNGIVYDIDGHTIGTGDVKSTLPRSIETTAAVNNVKDLINMSDVNLNIATSIHTIQMQGFGGNAQISGWKQVLGSDTVNGASISITPFINLGLKRNLLSGLVTVRSDRLTFTVVDSTQYAVTINDVQYTYTTGVGATFTEIQDGLIAAITDITVTVTKDGNDLLVTGIGTAGDFTISETDNNITLTNVTLFSIAKRPIEHHIPVQITEKEYRYTYAKRQDIGDTANFIIPLFF